MKKIQVTSVTVANKQLRVQVKHFLSSPEGIRALRVLVQRLPGKRYRYNEHDGIIVIDFARPSDISDIDTKKKFSEVVNAAAKIPLNVTFTNEALYRDPKQKHPVSTMADVAAGDGVEAIWAYTTVNLKPFPIISRDIDLIVSTLEGTKMVTENLYSMTFQMKLSDRRAQDPFTAMEKVRDYLRRNIV
jgi:hypothetical protein